MFRNALGASVNSRASSVELNFRPRLPREVVLVVLQAIFVGVTAVLFFTWVASLSAGGLAIWGRSSKLDCVSFGRGGSLCPSRSSADGRSIGDPRQDCVSMGRGGLVCDKPPTK